MEVEDVQPSHLPETDFEKNPRYGLENERRYHDEPASKKKVLDNAANLDPDFLLESVDANHGAPVIDHKGNVLGGNGRTMSIRHAYEKFPDRAQRYRQALREHAEELGFSAADVDAMRRPILVRQLDNDYDAQTRQQLVSALNDTFTDSKNARTSSKSRGEHFSQKTLESLASGLSEADSLRQYFDLPESAQTVELLISDGVIKTTERNACLGADGLLNPDGKRIVEEALRGRIARTYEALATLPGPVVAKIDAVIPHLLIAENCGSKWDMTRHMRDAIDLLAEHKASGNIAPEIFLSQMDMFKGNTPRDRYSLAAQCLFQMVLGMKKKEFAKAVEGYANQAKISPEAGGIPGVAMKPEIAREAFFKIPRNEGGNKSAVTPENTGLPETEQPSAPEKQRSDHPSQSPGTFGTIDAPDTVALAAHFSEAFLSGKTFGAIIEARREAGSLLGGTVRPATEAAKAVDEAVELGVTLSARRTVAAMRERHAGDTEIYRALVDLYQRQPRLNVRTSTSIAQQAYSTPAPIAFLASRLAGIDSGTRVFEPTAGNGMLLLEASPDRAAVNELNPDRASRLRSQGFEVTERDAVDFRPEDPVDVVIANPPFGRVKDAGRQTREFSVNGLTTKELDHAIVARALESLKQGGRAVLIIGGKQGNDASRSKKYRAADQVRFWGWLFERYRVLEHFCVDGKLYERQGAGYPIDVIVLENSGTSAGRPFPGAALPRVYTSFNALEEVLHGQVVDTAERKSGSDGTDTGRTGDGANQQRGRSDRPADAAGSEADRGSVRSGGNAGADGARSGERLDSGVRNDRPATAGGSRLQRSERPAPESGNDVSADAEGGRAGGERQTDVAADSQRGNAGKRGGRDDAGRLGQHRDGGDVRSELGVTPPQQSDDRPRAADRPKSTVFQVAYEPASAMQGMGTLVPRNMATAARQAMTALEKRHGSIDRYVAGQLGYPEKDLGKYFAAEQVDALGMAISNIADGSGFIIGDQTGIGKGRVNAGIIRWQSVRATSQSLSP